MRNCQFILIYSLAGLLFFSCKTSQKPYNVKRFPKKYGSVVHDFNKYYKYLGCKSGETIASIGAGNGLKEIQISCNIDSINWYLQEIDSVKLHEFHLVLDYHQKLIPDPIIAHFDFIIGTETATNLPRQNFERVLMINVFHELSSKRRIMAEIPLLMKKNGKLVIMERMGEKRGQFHPDCKYPKLYEPDFLQEMEIYQFQLEKSFLVSEMANLMVYVFNFR